MERDLESEVLEVGRGVGVRGDPAGIGEHHAHRDAGMDASGDRGAHVGVGELHRLDRQRRLRAGDEVEDARRAR